MRETAFYSAVAVVVGLSLHGDVANPFAIRTAWAAAPSKAPERVAADVRARELFQKGDVAYAEGRYEEALTSFQEAYDLSGRPQLLFNVSNALERLGRYSEAVEALEKYLASGKARDREVIHKRLTNLKKRVEEQRKAEERAREEEERRREGEGKQPSSEPTVVRVEVPTPAPPSSPPPPSEKKTRVFPIVLLGVGGAALATAGVFGALTLAARSDVDAECKTSSSGRLCSAAAQSAIDRDKTFGLVSDIALVSGFVLGGAGLYFLLTGKDDDRSTSKDASVDGSARGRARRNVRVEARPAGAGVEVVGIF